LPLRGKPLTWVVIYGRNKLLNTLLNFLSGLITTYLLGCLVGTIVKKTKALIPSSPPKESLKDKWENLTKDSSEMFTDEKKRININEVLGLFERLVFFIAFWLGRFEIVGGWLAFKVASKWEVWSNIVAFPKNLKDVDDLDYLIARRRLGAQIFTTFLVGTLANAIAAFIGSIVGRYSIDLFKEVLNKIKP
jgi:hypothetical protein